MEDKTLPDGTTVSLPPFTLTLVGQGTFWLSSPLSYQDIVILRRRILEKNISTVHVDSITGSIKVLASPEVNARLQAERGEEDWMAHLAKWGLLNLHHEALEVGYRIRVANGSTFDLEYQGGLPKYSQPPYWLKTFDDDPAGRNAARAFLAEIAADIKRLRATEA